MNDSVLRREPRWIIREDGEGRWVLVPYHTNNPLTPEQLREMEGEPVYLSGVGLGRWDIFCGTSTDGLACFLRGALPMDGCGKTWTPYRRKPEVHPVKGGPAYDAERLHQGGADLRH